MPFSQDGQSYKKYDIYIEDSVLTLTNVALPRRAIHSGENLQLTYLGKPKSLLHVIEILEHSRKSRHVVVIAQDVRALWRDFCSLYKRINAAGGIVENAQGQILCIYRRKIWDLPKGKLDPGEKYKHAAVREVMEETGLKNVVCLAKLGRTLHTFHTRSRVRVLKVTRWYHMTSDSKKLVLQREEDIEDAKWLTPEEFLSGKYRMFYSIRDLVKQFIDYKEQLVQTIKT